MIISVTPCLYLRNLDSTHCSTQAKTSFENGSFSAHSNSFPRFDLAECLMQ